MFSGMEDQVQLRVDCETEMMGVMIEEGNLETNKEE